MEGMNAGSEDMNKHALGPRGYRFRPDLRKQSFAMLIMFPSLGTFASVSIYFNIDGTVSSPELSGLCVAIAVLGITLLGLWMNMSCRLDSLILSDTEITQQGVWKSKTIRRDEITEITGGGRLNKGAMLCVRTPETRLSFGLTMYTAQDVKEIIEYFRPLVSLDVYQAWSEFQGRLERRHQIQLLGFPPPSRRCVLLCALIFLLFAGLFLYCGALGVGVGYLSFGLGLAALGIVCLWGEHYVGRNLAWVTKRAQYLSLVKSLR